jgi:hypothetical protein
MRAAVAAHLRNSQTLATAATLAGIHRDTLHEWRQRGKVAAEAQAAGASVDASEMPFLDFWEATEVARAEAQAEAVGEIRAAGRAGNWHASKWYLERSFSEEWGPKSSTAVMLNASQASLSAALRRGRAEREAVEASAATDADDSRECGPVDAQGSP